MSVQFSYVALYVPLLCTCICIIASVCVKILASGQSEIIEEVGELCSLPLPLPPLHFFSYPFPIFPFPFSSPLS